MAQDPKNTTSPNHSTGTGKDGSNAKATQDAAQHDSKPADKGSAGHQSDSPTGTHPHGEKKTTP